MFTSRSPNPKAVAPSVTLATLVVGSCSSPDIIPPFDLFNSVVVADLDGDARLDLAACYARIADVPPHPGHVLVYLQDLSAPATFKKSITHDAGSDPEHIISSDLNGDGLLDLATVGYGSGNALVQLQTVPGQFDVSAEYPTGRFPSAIDSGDMNGDGFADFAVGDSTGVSLLFQDPTSGTFLAPVSAGLTSGVTGIAVADLDADGRLDVVATSEVIFVLLQDAARPGTFLAPLSYAVGAQPTDVVLADLDGDGRVDIATANLGASNDLSGSVSVLLQSSAKAGTFLTATSYDTGYSATGIAAGDLNGDSRMELVAAVWGPFSENRSANGSIAVFSTSSLAGKFGASTHYPTNGDAHGVALGDVNADGRMDIAAVDASNTVSILLNTSDGTLNQPVPVPR